jgi:phage terminase large subunit-like protein
MLSPKEYVQQHLYKLSNYLCEVTGGSINCGRYERLAVQRFIDHKSKYLYKENELVKVLGFFSLLNIPIKNETRQFVVMPFQLLWLASQFAIWKDETTRLYHTSYLLLSKKNNKSTYAAAVAIYVTICCGVLNAHSLMVAASREQARTLINSVEFIVKNSPVITDYFQINKNIIYNRTDKTINKIEIRASDAGKINSVGQGMALSIVDEFSYHKDAQLQQNIKSAQAFFLNHHQIIIGTTSNDLTNPSFEFYEGVVNILDGVITNDEIFTVIYQLDSKEEYKDKNNWRKSNPAIGETISYNALQSELDSCIAFPQKLETVLTHHFNIWTDHITESFIDDDIVKAILKDDKQIPEASTVYIGCDTSSLNDLSAISVLYHDSVKDEFVSKIYHIFPNNDKRRIKPGSIDLARWFISKETPDGCIIRCESKSLDENIVIDLVREINLKYKVAGFYYDPFNARIIANRIENELGVTCHEVRQNYTMSFPLKIVEKYINENRLWLDRNPCTRWQFRNVRVKTDRNNNYLITKRQGESVDGIVALTCAMTGLLNDNYSTFSNKINTFNF